MVKRQKVWMYKPTRESKPKVPDIIKNNLKIKADNFIETILKPKHIKPPPKDETFNYLVDIYSKWYQHYFYFIGKYRSPGPYAISPFFEDKFARLEYLNNGHFNLSYKRHTEQWWEIYKDFSDDECLEVIKDDPNFYP